MGYYKTVRKWVSAHYRNVGGRKVYVRGHYTTTRIFVPTKKGNRGFTSLKGLSGIFNVAVNLKTFYRIFSLESQSLADLQSLEPIERVPGISYKVIAGTQPYEIRLGRMLKRFQKD